MKRLTIKQKKFVYFYEKTANATKSAIKAGYSKRSARQIGTRLLSKDYISEYIKNNLKSLKSNTIADTKELLKFYTAVERGNITEPVVISTVDGGVYTETKKPSIKDRISASNELMKRYAPLNKAKISDAEAKAYVNRTKANQLRAENKDKHIHKPVPLVSFLKKIANNTSNGRVKESSERN